MNEDIELHIRCSIRMNSIPVNKSENQTGTFDFSASLKIWFLSGWVEGEAWGGGGL